MTRDSGHVCYKCGITLVDGKNWNSSDGDSYVCSKCELACPVCKSHNVELYTLKDITTFSQACCQNCKHEWLHDTKWHPLIGSFNPPQIPPPDSKHRINTGEYIDCKGKGCSLCVAELRIWARGRRDADLYVNVQMAKKHGSAWSAVWPQTPKAEEAERKADEIEKEGRKATKIVKSDLKPIDIKCPVCGGKTSVRTAKKGIDAGKRFNVCDKYPGCKGKSPI